MKIGTSVIDITPEPGVELSGFLARVQPSLGIHDRLAVRALYLEDGGQRLLWLHADLIGYTRELVAEVKQTLAARFGLRRDEVVLSATHTHSGPATIPLINAGTYDTGYVDRLGREMLKAAAEAQCSPEPAEMLVGEGRCALAVDRRGKVSAHADPRLGVVAWRRTDGSFAGVLANYPIHHVAMRADNRSISADMAGRAAATASTGLPGNPVVLVTNGACGNLNPPSVTSEFIQPTASLPTFAPMTRWGDQIAAAIVAAVSLTEVVPQPRLHSVLAEFDVRLQPFDAGQIRDHAAKLRLVYAQETGYVADRYRESVDLWERRMIARVGQPDWCPRIPVDVQILRFGETTWVCLGAEVFSVMADDLRSRLGRRLYVVGYANGDAGYLAPSAAYDEGGYEIESAFVFYGGLPVERGEFERLRDRVTDLVRHG
ncbi:MAG TPA: neutral/alkaline non-lysosomal ceramidase N-terminal domain-containing protein [Phycisphaerae bacterium]|nr:neutral/alkaline non-lysosomal ceramidase N-terminal domain-containing protein [Phycisphaerae bacterium]HRY69285.1 neutral/alkaline non-lysosomal ceramidase N-terminal domain-containing protein [Phycisphaerae bacterium]HSA26603.1 neutral/alkaline non-lysosomal ceramidase N-terminal domain-containing protein [Phycisphaerae bacterium]